MRLNKFLALATGISRRAADDVIYRNRVLVNGRAPTAGMQVTPGSDSVTMDSRPVSLPNNTTTIMLNKPIGFVCSREGQGNKTIYEILPEELTFLKPVGRLDKDSSGLLLLTNDGELAQQLTHPKYQKTKAYEIGLDKALAPLHRQMISDHGIKLLDGVSKLELERIQDGDDSRWRVTMREGRNRQIRRTFESLGYNVTALHRTHFGTYQLGTLSDGAYKKV